MDSAVLTLSLASSHSLKYADPPFGVMIHWFINRVPRPFYGWACISSDVIGVGWRDGGRGIEDSILAQVQR